MVRYYLVFSLFVLHLSFGNEAFGQSPYEFSFAKESKIVLGAGAGLSMAYFLQANTDAFSYDDLIELKSERIFGIDRSAINNHNTAHDQLSDLIFMGSFAFPVIFLGPKKTRNSFGKVALLYAETNLITGAVTNLSKSIFQRPRPYVFSSYTPDSDKYTQNAHTSFLSGHTSMTASNTFFMAKVFSDFYPESKLRPYVWGAAATIPAVVGYLRVSAGKHYPTDVFAGYLVGASIGILVPHLHKSEWAKKRNLNLSGGLSGVSLSFSF